MSNFAILPGHYFDFENTQHWGGDFLADDSDFGFVGRWQQLSGLLTVIFLLTFYSNVSKVILFWSALVITRPFGATFGDLLTKTLDEGGLDLGTAYASLFFLAILITTIL